MTRFAFISRITLVLLISLATLPLSAFAQSGGPFTLNWFTIDGGGGTSTGGVYSLSGTIGQPDAGRLTGGAYTLEGGFWGIVLALQQPGAPHLDARRGTSGSVIIAWPYPSTGFVLEETPTLVTPSWTPTAGTPTQVGGENVVTVPGPSGNRFYRLRKP